MNPGAQTPPTLSDEQKIRLLPWSVLQGATNAFFAILTFFGSVTTLFLDEVGLGKSQIGFLLSLLPFTGLLALFVAPHVGRIGYKRTFLIFWAARKAVTALLLAAPWVLWGFGRPAAMLFLTVIMLGFAVCRAVAETAWYPWNQEVVPDVVRGRFTAVSNIVTTIAMCLALALASHVIGQYRSWGLNRFMLLIAIALVFGVLSVATAAFIPGGRPIPPKPVERGLWLKIRIALRDRSFALFLLGLGLVSLGSSQVSAFLPLFAKEQVGLSQERVVQLDVAWMLGGLSFSYVFGWAADRYGSKGVMLGSLSLTLLGPLLWLATPRSSGWSYPVAMGVSCLTGIAAAGWMIGYMRLLYVGLVPPRKRVQYMAAYYAWIGLAGGSGPLLGGLLLDGCRTLSACTPFHFDPYVPLFMLGALLMLAGRLLLGRIALKQQRRDAGGSTIC